MHIWIVYRMIDKKVDAVNVHLRMRYCHFYAPITCSTTNVKNLSATIPRRTLPQIGVVELCVKGGAMDEMVELCQSIPFELCKRISTISQ
jgi:hypothetical protein